MLCIIVFIISTLPTNAQCTSTGVRNATAAASTSFAGSDFSFSNVTNIFSSDNSRATSTGLVALFNGQTEYLQATNFGFSVPPTAIICGITVEVEKSATGIGSVFGIGLSYVSDNSARLVRNGAGKSFYRLKMIGHNGETSYSEVKSVKIENNDGVKVIPIHLLRGLLFLHMIKSKKSYYLM